MTTLDELVKTFQEEKVVEQIMDAKNKLSTASLIQDFYAIALSEFKREREQGKFYYDEIILKENVVQICIICMMAGIDDYEILRNYGELPIILDKVTGKFEKLAKKIEKFIWQGKCFSDYDLESLVTSFFEE